MLGGRKPLRKSLLKIEFLAIISIVGNNRGMKRQKTIQPDKKATNGIGRVLSRRQAAELIDHSEKTLANWAVLGDGPPYRKARGRVLYIEAELLAWLQGLPRGGGVVA